MHDGAFAKATGVLKATFENIQLFPNNRLPHPSFKRDLTMMILLPAAQLGETELVDQCLAVFSGTVLRESLRKKALSLYYENGHAAAGIAMSETLQNHLRQVKYILSK